MAIEIEKKYRLSGERRERVLRRLHLVNAEFIASEFEENTLLLGADLDPNVSVLRIRRVGNKAILTLKRRLPSTSSIKHQNEIETVVDDADALTAIFVDLGFRPGLVYEKRRAKWRIDKVEVVMDELPFGFFMEIEGEENAIAEAEHLLELEDVEPEEATYPELTRKLGSLNGEVIEARF